MVNKHCCYGICNNDSRKVDICLKEGIKFIQFPDLSIDKARAERWSQHVEERMFWLANITRRTFVCNKHFVDCTGLTMQNPNPLPATISIAETDCLERRQRRSRKQRPAILSKKQ